MVQVHPATSRRLWRLWALVFLAFPVVVVGWVTAWLITRSAGIDFGPKWPVFGASGALAFQLLTGLALYFLLRSSRRNRLA